MNSTLWLLVGIIVFILVVLAALYGRKRWAEARDALDYRTINASTMESHVRAIHAQVPAARRSPAINVESVRARAVTAAIRDMGHKTTTLNPYQPASRAHAIWAENYARVMRDQKELHEEIAADEAAEQSAVATTA